MTDSWRKSIYSNNNFLLIVIKNCASKYCYSLSNWGHCFLSLHTPDKLWPVGRILLFGWGAHRTVLMPGTSIIFSAFINSNEQLQSSVRVLHIIKAIKMSSLAIPILEQGASWPIIAKRLSLTALCTAGLTASNVGIRLTNTLPLNNKLYVCCWKQFHELITVYTHFQEIIT